MLSREGRKEGRKGSYKSELQKLWLLHQWVLDEWEVLIMYVL
jgi:hypothetical protein